MTRDVAMTEYGQGFVTAAGQQTNDVVAMELGNNGAAGTVLQVNSLHGHFAAVCRSPRSPACSRPSSPGSRLQARPDPLRSGFGTSRAPRRSAPSRFCPRRPRAPPTLRSGSRPAATRAGTPRSRGCREPAPAPRSWRSAVPAAGRGDRVQDGPYAEARSRCSAGRRRAAGGDRSPTREPRRVAGRADPGQLAPRPGRAPRRLEHLVRHREQSGGPDRVLEGRAGVRRHDAAGVEGDGVGSARGRARTRSFASATATRRRPRAWSR